MELGNQASQEENKMKKIDRIALTDNVMFTSFSLNIRGDVEKAFDGSGMTVDPSCRIRYQDNGLLATFRAGLDDGEMESWLAIAWGTLRKDEQETWLGYWQKLESGEIK